MVAGQLVVFPILGDGDGQPVAVRVGGQSQGGALLLGVPDRQAKGVILLGIGSLEPRESPIGPFLLFYHFDVVEARLL